MELRHPIDSYNIPTLAGDSQAVIDAISSSWGPKPCLGVFHIALKAIGADPSVQYSFLPGLDLRILAKFDYDFLPDKTHFLQLEAPEDCADLTVRFLERHGLA